MVKDALDSLLEIPDSLLDIGLNRLSQKSDSIFAQIKNLLTQKKDGFRFKMEEILENGMAMLILL